MKGTGTFKYRGNKYILGGPDSTLETVRHW